MTTKDFVGNLGLLIIGGLMTAGPVLYSGAQDRRESWRREQVDQRVVALRDYSAACTRGIVTTRKVIELHQTIAHFNPKPGTPEAEWLQQQVGSAYQAMDDAIVSLKTAEDVASAVFQQNVRAPLKGAMHTPSARLEEDVEKGRAALDRLREYLPLLSSHCRANAELLGARLYE